MVKKEHKCKFKLGYINQKIDWTSERTYSGSSKPPAIVVWYCEECKKKIAKDLKHI